MRLNSNTNLLKVHDKRGRANKVGLGEVNEMDVVNISHSTPNVALQRRL